MKRRRRSKVEDENGNLDTDWERMLVQREERRKRKDEVEDNLEEQVSKVKPGER